MSLAEKLQLELKEALKGGDSFKSENIRMLLAAVQNEQIAKGKENELSEDDVVGVIRKEAKKRKEAVDIYTEAGRTELADKEQKELDFIKTYLPPEMETAEIEKIVAEVVAGGETNFGKVMGQVMQKVAGRAEPGTVSGLVKKALEGSEG